MSITHLRRHSIVAALAVLTAATACKSSTAANSAGAVAAAAGDNQTVVEGKAATTPLKVLVQDDNGSPAVGVTVSWSIVLGNGSLTAVAATTDASGYASANYTAGSSAATTTVEAKAGSNEVFFKLFVVPG